MLNENSFELLIIANEAGAGLLDQALSGGDRILIELVKRWRMSWKLKVRLIVNISGYIMYRRYLSNDEDFIVINNSGRNAKLWNFIPYIIVYEILLFLKSFKQLLSLKQREKISVIYSASEFLIDLIPAIILKKRLKGRLIATFYLFAPSPLATNVYRGIRRLRGLVYYIMQYISYFLIKRYADMVWVNNEIDRDRFMDGKKITAENVIAVGPGVDSKLCENIPPLDKKYDAVFIGRFHPQKGILELVDIWKFVREEKPDAKLAIIGVGYLERELREKIIRYGLTDAIDLLGFKDGVDKLRIVKASQVVLHPAIYESGGMAALEAMSCGLPGICFDLPVYKVYYPKGVLRTPCYDLRAFAANIIKLLKDRNLYKRLQEEALELARENDWGTKADYLFKIIKYRLLKKE